MPPLFYALIGVGERIESVREGVRRAIREPLLRDFMSLQGGAHTGVAIRSQRCILAITPLPGMSFICMDLSVFAVDKNG